MSLREIQASEAKTHLASLLDDVERGETIVITRHGRAVARLVPEEAQRHEQAAAAAAEFKAFRRTMPQFTAEEIRELIDEGRKY